MRFTVEQPIRTKPEHSFLCEVAALVRDSKAVEHCRQLAPVIRQMEKIMGLEIVIGCGASHIWLHRRSQFVPGDNFNDKNIRLAIITDSDAELWKDAKQPKEFKIVAAA